MKPLRRDFSETVIAKIDKTKKTEAQKAREAKITADAKLAAQRAIAQAGTDDVVLHCEGVLLAVKDALCANLDPEGAASTFGRFAKVSIYTGPIRRAAAEQAFAKLTQADNDRGAGE